MTRIALLITALAAVGCNPDAIDNTGVEPGTEGGGFGEEGRQPVESMGGQSGSEDIYECAEAARAVVTDPSVPAQGATVAAQVYLDLLDLDYAAEMTLDSDPQQVEVMATSDLTSLEFVVYGDVEEGWEVGDPIPYGVQDGCPDRYEWTVNMHTLAAPQLDELVATTAIGWGEREQLYVTSRVAANDVTGTLLPESFDVSTAPDPFLFLGFVYSGTGNAGQPETTLNVAWWNDDEWNGNPVFEMDDYGQGALTSQ